MNDLKSEWETESRVSGVKKQIDAQERQERLADFKQLDLSDRRAAEMERQDRFARNKSVQDKKDAQTRRNLNEQFRSIEERRQELNRSIE